MSNQALIHQTVVYGNPFEAIELNLFSCSEYVDYLAEKGSNLPQERLYLGFCALMKNYPSVYHYSSQGQHILTCLPRDKFLNRIFLLLGGSPELPTTKDDLNNTLWSLLFDEYSDFVSDVWSEEIEKAWLICDKITPKLAKRKYVFEEQEFIKTLYEFRCEKVLSKYKNTNTTLSYAIETDWFARYPIVKNHYRKFIHRIEFLQKVAPLYYEKMHEQILNLFSELTLREFENLDNELLKRTCSCFPDQFTNVQIKEEFQKLCVYPIPIRAYILGLPIYPKIPSSKNVDIALSKLSEIGLDAYVEEFIKNQSREKYSEDQIANTEDTLFEEPENYTDFDYLTIEENGKIYQFTRPEFAKLLSDKKNFWTKQPINFSDLYTLQIRINMAKVMNLPHPETLKVLIEKGCKGILYQESITQPNVSSQNVVPQVPTGSSAVELSQSISPQMAYSIEMLSHPNISSQLSDTFLQFFQNYLQQPSTSSYLNQIDLNRVGTGGFVNGHILSSALQNAAEDFRRQENRHQQEDETESEESEEHQEEKEQEEHERDQEHEEEREQEEEEEDMITTEEKIIEEEQM